MKKIKVISLKQPCTACVITTNLVMELMVKLKKRDDTLEIELLKLSHINELYGIEGVEVEKLPIILVDDEQITAGSFPKREMIKYYITDK